MVVQSMFNHPNGLPRTLSREDAAEKVRELVAEGGRVVWRPHALERMEERDITSTQIYNVLRRGEVVEDPKWSNKFDNWEIGFQDISAGDLLTVRVALDVEQLMGDVVLVITAFVK